MTARRMRRSFPQAASSLPRASRGTPMAKRLLDSILIDGNGCWQWQRYIGADNGYGRLTVDHRLLYAHRLSYETFIGPVPEGLVVDHLCRVRSCINPFHLEPVTVAENNRRAGPNCWAELTHCKHGHPFDATNTYQRSQGHRGCRACQRDRHRTYRARRKVAA